MAASTGTLALAASCLSSSSKANHSFKVSLAAVRICSALALRRTISLKPASSLLPYLLFSQKSRLFRQGSAMQDILLEDKHVVAGENSQFEEVNRTKLYVVNLPLDCTASYLENLFGRFGTVNGVEIIKKKNGENRGFAFVVMSSEEEAQVAIEKLNSYVRNVFFFYFYFVSIIPLLI
ncbi:hypothetical protein HPP92_021789 [Vanilla planifolia]|uniref:RRM domain-containing protein n=1 Tax=Vanilla planifolia TaxID=51239 RepID=A0A835PR18_VANPL|nr:hypothetical protein HPP92_021789 [Vanilla planifolia]